MPRAARRSSLGVVHSVRPLNPTSPHPMSSATIKTMLGGRSAARPANGNIASRKSQRNADLIHVEDGILRRIFTTADSAGARTASPNAEIPCGNDGSPREDRAGVKFYPQRYHPGQGDMPFQSSPARNQTAQHDPIGRTGAIEKLRWKVVLDCVV